MGATGTKHFKITFKQELLWYHPNIIRSFEPNIPQAPQIDLFHNRDLGTTLNFSEMSNYYIFFGWICLHCWPFLIYETSKCQRNVMMRSFLLVIKLSIILKSFMAETVDSSAGNWGQKLPTWILKEKHFFLFSIFSELIRHLHRSEM